MREEKVPQGGRKGAPDSGEDSKEVRLERTDRALRCVASVYVGRHKLKRALPLLADRGFKVSTGLVVKDNEVDSVSSICEALHDSIVGWDAVPVAFGGERFYEDRVGIIMIR